MKCPLTGKPCNKHRAYFITEIKGSSATTLNVCEDCLHSQSKTDQIESPEYDKSCDFCGLKLKELFKGSRIGCANCYTCFDKYITLIVMAINESFNKLKHVGRVPELFKIKQAEETDPKKFLLELNQKLKIAVKNENYKKASNLKNEIIAFSAILDSLESNSNDEELSPLIRDKIINYIYSYREKEREET